MSLGLLGFKRSHFFQRVLRQCLRNTSQVGFCPRNLPDTFSHSLGQSPDMSIQGIIDNQNLHIMSSFLI
jgi:hypothetical protein